MDNTIKNEKIKFLLRTICFFDYWIATIQGGPASLISIREIIFFPRKFNQGEHRTAELGQAEKNVSIIILKSQTQISAATHDRNGAATSLLTLCGTDVDKVLCAGGSLGGWKGFVSVYTSTEDDVEESSLTVGAVQVSETEDIGGATLDVAV